MCLWWKSGNEYEENCHIFLFKSLVCIREPGRTTRNNKKPTCERSRVNNNNNKNSNTRKKHFFDDYDDINDEVDSSSFLIGYSQIKYYKDNYTFLCEYLFHSVYDSNSLEQFELEQYLSVNIKEEQCEEKELIDQIERLTDRYQSSRQLDLGGFNFIKSSPFFNYYLNYLSKLRVTKYTIDNEKLDDFLTKAFKFVQIPSDWTLLGQYCYLDKSM